MVDGLAGEEGAHVFDGLTGGIGKSGPTVRAADAVLCSRCDEDLIDPPKDTSLAGQGGQGICTRGDADEPGYATV